MDVFAETADACFMDAWLRAVDQRARIGRLRNQYLDALFQSVEARRELCLEDTTPERVVQSQQVHVRRKQELIHFRHPRHASPEAPVHATRRERLEWWLQQRTQRRSKAAWGRYGRRYGRFVFWAVMLDLLWHNFFSFRALHGFSRSTACQESRTLAQLEGFMTRSSLSHEFSCSASEACTTTVVKPSCAHGTPRS